MTEEDEAFNDIERQAKQRKEAVKATLTNNAVIDREDREVARAMELQYERGFIDGMQKQMQSSVDKAVNRMARTWVGLTDEEVSEVFGGDIHAEHSGELRFARAIEAKLKELNT